jgi:hypothetical protein
VFSVIPPEFTAPVRFHKSFRLKGGDSTLNYVKAAPRQSVVAPRRPTGRSSLQNRASLPLVAQPLPSSPPPALLSVPQSALLVWATVGPTRRCPRIGLCVCCPTVFPISPPCAEFPTAFAHFLSWMDRVHLESR